MRANTGRSVDPEAWRKRCERKAKLKAQNERIADALERQGVVVRQPSTVTAVGDVTGCVEPVTGYRAVRILPTIAQRDRAPMLAGLRYFMANNPIGRHVRMAVITSGERVPLFGDLRGRQEVHARRISKWASEARRRYGVEVLLRSTEDTLKDGGAHWHGHVLYAPMRRLPADEWAAFLSWTGRFLRAYWQDCGRLKEPQEAIKYHFKPSELEGQPDAVLHWLYRETKGLKLVQPMGAFAEFMRELKQSGQKLVMVNREGRGAQLQRVQRPRRDPVGKAGSGGGPVENMLLPRMLPQARFCRYGEPVTLVGNFTRNPETTGGRQRLAIMAERAREARVMWDRNGAPPPDVALAESQGQAAAEPGRAGAVLPFQPPAAAGTIRVHTSRPTVRFSRPAVPDSRPSTGQWNPKPLSAGAPGRPGGGDLIAEDAAPQPGIDLPTQVGPQAVQMGRLEVAERGASGPAEVRALVRQALRTLDSIATEWTHPPPWGPPDG
jgi:hypothetical protein